MSFTIDQEPLVVGVKGFGDPTPQATETRLVGRLDFRVLSHRSELVLLQFEGGIPHNEQGIYVIDGLILIQGSGFSRANLGELHSPVLDVTVPLARTLAEAAGTRVPDTWPERTRFVKTPPRT